MSPSQLSKALDALEARMYKHAENLEFEEAAKLRDELDEARRFALGPGAVLATGTNN